MTISSTNRKAGPFLGNGSTSTFSFAFKVFQASDIDAVAVTAGVETVLVLDSDYTASLNADQDVTPGGSITLLAGPLATGTNLIITSDTPELQSTDLTNLGAFYPEVINAALDLVTILVQQIQEQVNRSLHFPITDPALTTNLGSAAARANKLLGFGSDGSPSLLAVAPTGATLFSGVATGTKDGTNKVFTLTNGGSPIGRTPLQATVWQNFPLAPGVGYTLGPSPGQVTYTIAPAPTDVLFAQGAC